MAIHFVLGGSGRGKSYYIHQMVEEWAQKEPEQQIMVIVPEQFTMQTQKELVTSSPRKGILNIDVQSFIRLAYRVFGETGAGNIPVLDDMGKTMILRKVLEQHKDSLQYFGRNIHKKGYVAEIKSFLSEMLQYGMDAAGIQEMADAAKDKPALCRKLQDMVVAYEAFTGYLADNYITSEEVLSVFCDEVSSSTILKDAVICLDGFTGFTPIQYRLIEQLMMCCREIYVTVTMDIREQVLRVGPKHQLFYMSRNTIAHIRELAQKHHIEVGEHIWTGKELKETRYVQAPGIASLEQNLFRYPFQTYKEKPTDISIHLLSQPEAEVAYVIQKILELRLKEDCRYRDIAVVTGDMETYGLLAQDAFEQADMPCFIDQKKSILTHPYVETIRALLDVLSTDFTYDAVMRFLRGRYCGLTREDINILDNFLLASGIRGAKKWQAEWSCGALYRLREEEKVSAVDDRLNDIRKKVWDMLQELQERIGRKKHSVREYAESICLFIERQNYYEALQRDSQQFMEEGQASRAKEYDQVYEIVIGVFDRLVELLGEEQISLKEFVELLETGFSEARVGLIPPGVDTVMVGDISRSRLADVKYLFFLGVNDGVIPKTGGGGGILSDTERNFLEEQDFTLAPTTREIIFTEQFYLYLNLTKPQRHLYICYPETGTDGVALQPSYLIDRLQKLFPKLTVCVEEMEQDDQHILGKDGGRSYLIHGLRSGRFEDSKWQEIYRYYWSQERSRHEVMRLVDAAFYREKETQISKAAARLLYHEVLRGSASALERYGACAFAYYLQYGLRLEERAEHAVEFFDIGNVVHEALELYTRELLKDGMRWQDVEEEEQHKLADRCLDQTVDHYKAGLMYDTQRSTYLVRRLRRILYRSVWAISKQMEQGDFTTADSELKFEQQQGPLNLVGRVDRLDTMSQTDADYITIVDYKTGQKKISLSDMYYGLQMQLVIYLKSAVEEYKRQNTKKLVIPAGVYYYNIDDPILEGKTGAGDHDEEIMKALRLSGLSNEDDPVLQSIDRRFQTESGDLPVSEESIVTDFGTDAKGNLKKRSTTVTTRDFTNIMEYTEKKLVHMSQEILDGHIEINPYRKEGGEGKSGCDYCPYHGICRFNTRIAGNRYRIIKKKSDDDVLHEIEQTNL